jgi:hypothetical protein
MYALSTIGNSTLATKDGEDKTEVRLVFSVPKSEENLRSSTVFENEGSKQGVGGRGKSDREVSTLK